MPSSTSPVQFRIPLGQHKSQSGQVIQVRSTGIDSPLKKQRGTKELKKALQLAKDVGTQAGKELAKRTPPEKEVVTIQNILNISNTVLNETHGHEFAEVMKAALLVKEKEIEKKHQRRMAKLQLRSRKQNREHYMNMARHIGSYGPNVVSLGGSGVISYMATKHISGLSTDVVNASGNLMGGVGTLLNNVGSSVASATDVWGVSKVASLLGGGIASLGTGITATATKTTEYVVQKSEYTYILAGLILFFFLYFAFRAFYKVFETKRVSLTGGIQFFRGQALQRKSSSGQKRRHKSFRQKRQRRGSRPKKSRQKKSTKALQYNRQ